MSLKARNRTTEHQIKLNESLKKYKMTDEHKRKISIGTKLGMKKIKELKIQYFEVT